MIIFGINNGKEKAIQVSTDGRLLIEASIGSDGGDNNDEIPILQSIDNKTTSDPATGNRQEAANTSLNSIDAKLPNLGSNTKAFSTSVTLATDDTVIGNDITGTLMPAGGSGIKGLLSWLASIMSAQRDTVSLIRDRLPTQIGQQASINSFPVTLSSETADNLENIEAKVTEIAGNFLSTSNAITGNLTGINYNLEQIEKTTRPQVFLFFGSFNSTTGSVLEGGEQPIAGYKSAIISISSDLTNFPLEVIQKVNSVVVPSSIYGLNNGIYYPIRVETISDATNALTYYLPLVGETIDIVSPLGNNSVSLVGTIILLKNDILQIPFQERISTDLTNLAGSSSSNPFYGDTGIFGWLATITNVLVGNIDSKLSDLFSSLGSGSSITASDDTSSANLIQLIKRLLSIKLGENITGTTIPTGGIGILGWLSGLWQLINVRIPTLTLSGDKLKIDLTNTSTNPIFVTPTTTGTTTVQGTVTANLGTIAGVATQATLFSIDGKTPILGQSTVAQSSPVVLPAAQITALTPLLPSELLGNKLPVILGDTYVTGNITTRDLITTSVNGFNSQFIYSGIPTAGSTVVALTNGNSNFIATVSGTFTGNLEFSRTNDGIIWILSTIFVNGSPAANSVVNQICVVSGNCSGATQIRVRASGVTMTGTANIFFSLSPAAGGIAVMNLNSIFPNIFSLSDSMGGASSSIVSFNALYDSLNNKYVRSRTAGATGEGLGRTLVASGTRAFNLGTFTATGAGSWIDLGSAYRDFSVQLVVNSGSMTTISYTLEGSLNGINPDILVNSTDTTNGRVTPILGKPVQYVRLNLNALTGTANLTFLGSAIT